MDLLFQIEDLVDFLSVQKTSIGRFFILRAISLPDKENIHREVFYFVQMTCNGTLILYRRSLLEGFQALQKTPISRTSILYKGPQLKGFYSAQKSSTVRHSIQCRNFSIEGLKFYIEDFHWEPFHSFQKTSTEMPSIM